MRIRARRGSVSLEVVMIVPVAVTLLLIGRYVLEAGLTRQEVAVYTRTAAANAADAASTSILHCDADRDPFSARPTVSLSAGVSCARTDGERGLQRERPFFDALKKGADPFPRITRDVENGNELRDISKHLDNQRV